MVSMRPDADLDALATSAMDRARPYIDYLLSERDSDEIVVVLDDRVSLEPRKRFWKHLRKKTSSARLFRRLARPADAGTVLCALVRDDVAGVAIIRFITSPGGCS